MKRIILPLALSLAAPLNAYASLNGCVAEEQTEKRTMFYYANGVGNSFADAVDSMTALESAYKYTLPAEEETYTFGVAYNNTQGLQTDLMQVMVQKMTEYGIDGDPYLMYTLILEDFDESTIEHFFDVLLSDSEIQAMRDAIRETMVDAMRDLVADQNLQTNIYESDLLSGRRVMVVAHSQGNLYSNSIVSAVKERQPERSNSIGYFGVASPAGSVNNYSAYVTVQDTAYVTAEDDRVINPLRDSFTVLPANIDNDPGIFEGRDWMNHGFLQSYFDSELDSRARIDTGVGAMAANLTYPATTAGVGALRASLTWGEQRDVDLHAFEPDGTHVYYRNKQGSDGSLDVDDVTSFGPENYVVPCESINPGEYTIGVNYYAGNAPETASVSLFLGNGQVYGPRETLLENSRGSSGNDSPEIMFTITVADDGNGNAVYTVE
ncbi:YfaP family protein [Alteromonas halophila]|uniref:DUF2135 domain-containing protein n=1 Tax=Alteromonas halophila TaxID=516698 RepID=A0A918JJJ6_9ALTE|nr:hypothetical protein [Alteromonas halophila]GGW81698.1 hypothetical protein GCM10007391_13650 [Alteromonas halophila]